MKRSDTDAMALEEAITGRRSVRAFTHAAVDPALIKQLIDAAVQAPSAMNQQPWVFTVVRDQGGIDSDIRRSEAAYAPDEPRWATRVTTCTRC